jgi:hypothetical protein
MKLDLQVRDLQTGVRGVRTFVSIDEAAAWLRDRPRWVEVLGVASHHVSYETSLQLKGAMRPLDEDERECVRDLEEAADEAARRKALERQKREQEEARRHAEALATADPNRAMVVHYSYTGTIRNGEPGDPREVTEAAREAVIAWVAERNEWVAGRGQVVGEASVQLWPGPLPDDESGRIIAGTFIPVSAGQEN